jgi:hypothetical protein
MANPNIFQGVANRLLASVVWDQAPNLNVTPSYLAPEGIDITPEGPITTMLPTMTGLVTSPEPYQMIRIVIHLVRAQALAGSYKIQWERSALIGSGTVRPDVSASVLSPFIVSNVAITGLNTLNFSGREVQFVVTCTGAYNINADLWD